MLAKGDIFQPSWGTKAYRADLVWGGVETWHINAKAIDNKLWSGSFCDLGKIDGNIIPFNDPQRGSDHLIILKQGKTTLTAPPKQLQGVGMDVRTKPQEAFAVTAEIRRARETLNASFAEHKKAFKIKSRALDKGLASVYEEYDSNQLTLFETGSSIPEETQKVLDNPTL